VKVLNGTLIRPGHRLYDTMTALEKAMENMSADERIDYLEEVEEMIAGWLLDLMED
jgi:Mg/Co/Ni transporter MgtE